MEAQSIDYQILKIKAVKCDISLGFFSSNSVTKSNFNRSIGYITMLAQIHVK